MSDFLKKLKSVFIVEDPAAAPTNATPPSVKPSVTPVSASIPSAISATTGAGKVTDTFTQILFSALEKNNQEGFDYIEYKRSLQTLEQMPMDEKTRYFSAFAAAQSMGISQQKLVDSASFYLTILKNEENKFQEATKSQREKQIGGKEKAIQSLAADIKAKGEQIARLTEEIQANQKEMEAMKNEISESIVKIETTMNDFTASYSNLANQIQTDIQKINEYVK
jgi:septal ring factor EnvC (AmiA/AmiB activator)